MNGGRWSETSVSPAGLHVAAEFPSCSQLGCQTLRGPAESSEDATEECREESDWCAEDLENKSLFQRPPDSVRPPQLM